MPVSEVLRRLSLEPGFWTGEISDPDLLPELLRVSFPVVDGYALILEIEQPSGERTLGLRRPVASEPVQIGWAPAGGPYPLRCAGGNWRRAPG